MNCRQLQESLGDHSVGLLDNADMSEFERHVALCADCARSVRQFRRCMELLDHMAPPRAPDDLWMGIRARLEVERSVSVHLQETAVVPPRRTSWRSGILATAAGFAATALVMLSVNTRQPSTRSIADDSPARASTTPVIWNPAQGSFVPTGVEAGQLGGTLNLGPNRRYPPMPFPSMEPMPVYEPAEAPARYPLLPRENKVRRVPTLPLPASTPTPPPGEPSRHQERR